ncbi:MAG: hypothetical protein WAK62_02415 [Terriglobales bacterium]
MSGKHSPKYKKFNVHLSNGPLRLYASPKVLAALEEVTIEMDLYDGVRLSQVMKAVYEQGCKDGRKEIIEKFQGQLDGVKKHTKYLGPGRPKKQKTIEGDAKVVE